MNTSIAGYQGTGSCNTLGDCTSVPIYEINNVFQEEGAVAGHMAPTTSKSAPA